MPHAVSFWEKDTWLQPADVLILGGGLLGLWTAIQYKQQQPSKRVVLIDHAPIPTGASTRNAGFACFGSPSEMLYDAQLNGTDAMLQVVEMRYKGIQQLRSTLGDERIGLELCGGFECYTEWPHDFDDKLHELNTWLAPIMGTPQAFAPMHQSMYSMQLQGFAGMAGNLLEGAVHSGKLVQAMLQLAQEKGVQCLYGLQHNGWQPGQHNALETAIGHIPFHQLVIATNAYLSSMMPQLGIKPARGQVLVSVPLEGLKMHGTFHFDEGFYYWRHLGNRILLGGARNADFAGEETLDTGTSQVIQQQLEQFLIRHLPQYFSAENLDAQIDYRWGGLMAMNESKLPVLQALAPNVWGAMSCNGMGVAITPVFAAQVVRSLLTNA